MLAAPRRHRIHDAPPTLTALDQAIGDGDHGTNMDRGFAAIVGRSDAGPPEADGELAWRAARLRTVGRTLISTVGGAAGPLYGTAFLRAGGIRGGGARSASSRRPVGRLDARRWRDPGLGKSTTGEKTMLDALMPAAAAGRERLAAGGDTAGVVIAIADAAAAGAASTIPDDRDEGPCLLPR
jgi:dihydroxyacetone kinase-like protein